MTYSQKAEAWQKLAAMLPPQDELDVDDVALLGNRPRDIAANWTAYYNKYPVLCALKDTYWKDLRAIHTGDDVRGGDEDLSLRLNPEQRLIHDRFVNHLKATLDRHRQTPQPLT